MPLNARQFEAAMSLEAREAYATIEALAREILDRKQPSDPPLTTAQMADLIYGGFDVYADEKLFKGLRACADHDMKAYATRGPLEMIGQHMGRRLYWHAPKTFCKECGRAM